MAAPVWPSTLPQRPLSDGFSRQPRDPVLGFDTEVGPGKRRTRSGFRIYDVAATFRLNSAQLTTFNTFFETTIGFGAKVFTWVDPLDNVSHRWRFNRSKPYSMSNRGGDITDVACNLERIG